MDMFIKICAIVFCSIVILLILFFAFLIIRMRYANKKQVQHSILRNFPILGIFRYKAEKIGPEARQYFTDSDIEGKPFSRYVYQHVVKLGKYANNIIGLGSKRDFQEGGFYMPHAMIPEPNTEKEEHDLNRGIDVDNSTPFETQTYKIIEEGVFKRHEKAEKVTIKPYLLKTPIRIGNNDPLVQKPWETKSFFGMSAMSYGALGDHAIEAAAHGLALAETWLNTGEGGLAPIHLVGGGQVVFQFGPGMFGVRDENGDFNPEQYAEKVSHHQVVATEVKFHQGSKIEGGNLLKSKITALIAKIRGIVMGKDCISPNTFKHIKSNNDICDFVRQLKEISGKPVGIKIVVGQVNKLEALIAKMVETNSIPNFITVDGKEGGSGATYQDMADVLGLPIFNSIVILNGLLKKYGIRNKVKIFAAGKLLTPDQIAIALALGADCCNTARGVMISLGCIMAGICHTNECPSGVATQDPKLQDGLVIHEKKYRVANYFATVRKRVFHLVAAEGLDSPTKLNEEHIAYQCRNDGIVIQGTEWIRRQLEAMNI